MRDAGHRTPDAGHRTSDGEKSKNNISTPQGGGHNYCTTSITQTFSFQILQGHILSEHIERGLFSLHNRIFIKQKKSNSVLKSRKLQFLGSWKLKICILKYLDNKSLISIYLHN